MTGTEWGGLVGGIAGCVLGVAGGVVGTYFSLKNTETERERALMVRYVAAFWAVGLAVLALMLLAAFGVLPEAVYWAVWIAFMCLLGPAIALGNRRLARARSEGSPEPPPED